MVGIVQLRRYYLARKEYQSYNRWSNVIYCTSMPIIQEELNSIREDQNVQPTKKPYYNSYIETLHKENADLAAWITIEGTDISYPIVKGKDNAFYQNHTFRKKENPSGAIFMDFRNAKDFTDYNTVIYGHNMKDGSMFHGLRNYQDKVYALEHAEISILCDHKKLIYQIISAYIREDEFDFRAQNCKSPQEKRKFFEEITMRSENRLFNEPPVDTSLLTLVTCTGGTHDWYFVVHAMLTKEE